LRASTNPQGFIQTKPYMRFGGPVAGFNESSRMHA